MDKVVFRMQKFIEFPAIKAAEPTMSGEQFCRLLKDLGYDGTTALSLDWMFDYEVRNLGGLCSRLAGHKAHASMDGQCT